MIIMTVRYNQSEERLEVCLGVDHVPVGPLTKEQTELAKLAATQSNHADRKTESNERKLSIKIIISIIIIVVILQIQNQ